MASRIVAPRLGAVDIVYGRTCSMTGAMTLSRFIAVRQPVPQPASSVTRYRSKAPFKCVAIQIGNIDPWQGEQIGRYSDRSALCRACKGEARVAHSLAYRGVEFAERIRKGVDRGFDQGPACQLACHDLVMAGVRRQGREYR